MKIVFRRQAAAAPGDVLLVPRAAEHRRTRRLATYVLEHGLEGLEAGDGPAERCVVQADPTLDDLLAATFVQWLAAKKPLPKAARDYARYAALVREGFEPSDVPLEDSLEGVYLAVRNDVGPSGADLTDPAAAERFLSGWARIEGVLAGAMEASKDPWKTPLFSDDSAFSRERAFLRRDREVYLQDVRRGERWVVELDAGGAGPLRGAGLVLTSPKCLLFKQWSRRDREAPLGGPYIFLAVRFGKGEWRFSTDPVQRLSLLPLAEALERAEAARGGPARAAAAAAGESAWFDGAPFGHTLVGAPHGGTALPDRAVLRIVRRRLSARRVRAVPIPLLAGAAAAAFGAAVALALVFALREKEPDPPFRLGRVLADHEVKEQLARTPAERYALIVGVGKEPNWKELPSCRDAVRVFKLLRDRFGFPQGNMRLLLDDQSAADEAGLPYHGVPTAGNVRLKIKELGKKAKKDRPLRFVFFYSGHGEKAERTGYLVLSGYGQNESDPNALRGFNMKQLYEQILEELAAEQLQLLMLLDCCHGGFAGAAPGRPRKDGAICEGWSRIAHVLITAADREQEALAESKEVSVFTKALTEGLERGDDGSMKADWNRDAIVSDEELGAYLREVVPRRADEAEPGHIQTPRYFRGKPEEMPGQFLFVPAN